MENQKDLPKPLTDLPLPEKEIPAMTTSALGENDGDKKRGSSIFLSKFFLGFMALSFLIAFLIGGFALGKNSTSKQSSIGSPKPTAKAAIPDPTANWKTYTNTKVGFMLKYPSRFPKPMLPSGAPDSPTVYATGTEDNADVIFGEKSEDSYTLKIFPTQESLDQIIKNPIYIGYYDKIVVVKKLTVAGTEAIWSISVHPTVYPEDKSQHTLIFFKHLNYGFIFDTYNSNSENEISQILSTFKFTDSNATNNTTTLNASPTEAALAGMKWYDTKNGLRFQVPTDFVYNNSSTSDFISFLQKQNDIMAQRMNVQIVKTSDSLEAYLQKNNYDDNGINSPAAHEPTTINGYRAIEVTKTFDPEQSCNIPGSGQVKRTSALAIQGTGKIYVFVVNDSCYTVASDWFSKIFPTIRITK